ncbi:DNA-directed RNA polymerase subunit beta'' [Helianthus anomalus]
MVRHNSIIEVDTQITLNRRSRVGGLVRVKKKAEKIKLIIFPGDIKAFRLIPPGGGKQNSKEYKKLKNWLYIQRMKLSRKYFVLVQPVVPYKKTDGIKLGRLFPADLLQESDNAQLRVVKYILYYDPILEIWDTSIQLVRTCLVLNWDQDEKIEKAYASFVEMRTNGLIRVFLRIDLAKSPISYTGKRNYLPGSRLISENGSDSANGNPISSIYSYSKATIQESLNPNQGTIHTLLNRNKESQSLIVLS